MKKIVKIIIILAVIAALAILGIKAVKHKRAQETKIPQAKIYPIVVSTMIPAASDVRLPLPYLATVVNEADVTLSSRIASRVEKIVKSGVRVTQGETVAQLDTTDLNANIEAVKVSLANARKSYERTKALYKVKGASVEQLQKEQSQIASLEAKLKGLENQLSYATITAPVDGTVAKTMAAVGDVAMPGKPLMRISADNGFSLLVRTPQDMTPKAVLFGGKSYLLHALGSTYHGLREYKAYIDTAKGLSAGERVEVNVVIFEGNGVKLPFDAILDRGGKTDVMVVEKNHARAKEVHIIQSGEQGVVVTDAPTGKKIVVAKPDVLLKLTSGHALKVKE